MGLKRRGARGEGKMSWRGSGAKRKWELMGREGELVGEVSSRG